VLSFLRVSDLALVEGVEVDFRGGLNVLSGETGAGKTVLIGAIGLLLGDRADTTMVRTGAEEAVLEASFDLSACPAAASELAALGYIEEGSEELTIGRRLSREGKGRCTVNGRLCPVSALTEIGNLLVEVHGQNAHQALLKQSSHMAYLDRHAGAEHQAVLSDYQKEYRLLLSLQSERSSARAAGGVDVDREVELLTHEIAEIETADPQDDELLELESRASKLRHAAELFELASRAEGALSAGEQASASVRDLLSGASADLSRMSERDQAVRPLRERVESLALEAEDAAAELGRYRESLETDPELLLEVEARLSLLRELCRKYGGNLETVSAYRERAEARLAEVSALAHRSGAIEKEIAAARATLEGLAGKLSANRRASAEELERAVTSEMAGLELSGASFLVSVADREKDGGDEGAGRFGPSGRDEVEFLFSPEPGEPPRPLRKIASGGEMSRVMLAMKIVLAGADMLPVLVFDEVDAGIGGETATNVGQKLYELTPYHQVFCVTHQPQIASFADWQYGVFKDKGDGPTSTGVKLLEGEDRVTEMCRMMGDSTGRKVTAEHARDILERAGKLKKTITAGAGPTPAETD